MSDGLLQWVFGDAPPMSLIHPLKGLVFILVTSLLLHRLVRRIGEAAQAEAVLRQDQQRLLVMLENMPVLVAAFDRDHQVALWNREAERVTGYSAAEAIGNPRIMELLLPDPDYRRATRRRDRPERAPVPRLGASDHLQGRFRPHDRGVLHRPGFPDRRLSRRLGHRRGCDRPCRPRAGTGRSPRRPGACPCRSGAGAQRGRSQQPRQIRFPVADEPRTADAADGGDRLRRRHAGGAFRSARFAQIP